MSGDPVETFDARRIPFKLIPGSAKTNDTKPVGIVFYPETTAESKRLYLAIENMRRRGLFKIEVAKPREHTGSTT